MAKEQKNGLKGQYIIAQDKRSGALGGKSGRRIVRPARQGLSGGVITFIKEKIMFRTREITLFSRK